MNILVGIGPARNTKPGGEIIPTGLCLFCNAWVSRLGYEDVRMLFVGENDSCSVVHRRHLLETAIKVEVIDPGIGLAFGDDERQGLPAIERFAGCGYGTAFIDRGSLLQHFPPLFKIVVHINSPQSKSDQM